MKRIGCRKKTRIRLGRTTRLKKSEKRPSQSSGTASIASRMSSLKIKSRYSARSRAKVASKTCFYHAWVWIRLKSSRWTIMHQRQTTSGKLKAITKNLLHRLDRPWRPQTSSVHQTCDSNLPIHSLCSRSSSIWRQQQLLPLARISSLLTSGINSLVPLSIGWRRVIREPLYGPTIKLGAWGWTSAQLGSTTRWERLRVSTEIPVTNSVHPSKSHRTH